MKTLKHPRWEDFNYGLLPAARGNGLAWMGNGLTMAQQNAESTAAFLEEVNVPSIINPGPRPDKQKFEGGALGIIEGRAVTNGEDGLMASAISGLPA